MRMTVLLVLNAMALVCLGCNKKKMPADPVASDIPPIMEPIDAGTLPDATVDPMPMNGVNDPLAPTTMNTPTGITGATPASMSMRGAKSNYHQPVTTFVDERVIETPRQIIVPLVGRSKARLSGTVDLKEVGNKVEITVTIKGAKNGTHSVHLHQKADCSAPDASSAGDYWTPDQLPHAMAPYAARHADDLGNIELKHHGKGQLVFAVPNATLRQGNRSLLGLALVVHANADDRKKQQAFNPGDRIGCAAIVCGPACEPLTPKKSQENNRRLSR